MKKIELVKENQTLKNKLDNLAIFSTTNDNILDIAIANNNLEIVKILVDHGNLNIHHNNDNAVRLAAKKGFLSIVKYLCEEGAYIHANNDEILYEAVKNNNIEIVKYLIEKANANIYASNYRAIDIATENGNLELIKYFIEKFGFIIISNNNFNIIVLAIIKGHLNIIKYLFEEKNVNLYGDDQDVIYRAIENKHLDIIKYFIEKVGFSINIKFENGDTILQHAIKKNYTELINYIACFKIQRWFRYKYLPNKYHPNSKYVKITIKPRFKALQIKK